MRRIILSSVACPAPPYFNTQCTRLHTGSVGLQPQHLVLNTTCSSKQPVYKKTPEDGHIDVRNT